MSAVNLRIEWKQESRQADMPVTINQREDLFRRGGTRQGPTLCPSCRSIVYSKRHKLCGVCGRELPAACRFSADTALAIETMMRTEKERYRTWLRRVFAE